MVRVKRGVMTRKRHKELLKNTKGFRMLNSRVFSRAKTAWMKSGLNSYIGRKTKKRDFRRLWTIRINTAARDNDTTYSRFIHAMYLKSVKLNRKVLSNLAITNPTVFTKVVEFVK